MRQHRCVRTSQLRALGLSADGIAYRVSVGRLHPVHRGVYSVGTPAATALERANAAVLACGDRALLSHESALALWGLRHQGWPSRMEVTAPTGHRHPGLRAHRSRTLTRADVRRRHGIRVTSAARTLLDCAPRLGGPALTRAVNDALRARAITREQLTELLRRCPNHPGAAALNPHAATVTGITRSGLEDEFLAFCRRFGLPRPQVNAQVGGYEVDAYFAEAGLIVELDGWEFHNDRRTFERDRLRDAEALAAGLGTMRITWERLHRHPHEESTRLAAILARRSSGPG